MNIPLPNGGGRKSDLELLLEDFNERLDRLNLKLKRRAQREPWITVGCSFIGYLLAMLVIKGLGL